MQDEDKDRYKDKMLKYLDMPKSFQTRANDIDIATKVSMRKCEVLAKHLAKSRPKTPEEFERVEYLKETIVATAAHNEAVEAFLRYTGELLKEVAEDAKALCDGADLRNKLLDQGDTILRMIDENKEIMQIQAKRERMYKAKIAEYERDKRG